jgi:hypothetical protein
MTIDALSEWFPWKTGKGKNNKTKERQKDSGGLSLVQ